jgi:signal transduction histidine kinase
MQRLVNDLQELSRAETAQLQVVLRPNDPVELVNLAVAALRPQFDDKGITLETDLPAEAPPVRADLDRIRQVLVNLLGNSLQYTSPGGRVIVRLTRGDSAMRFSVQDTGIGLDAAT